MQLHDPLTASETRVSALLLEGLSNKAIAKRLVLSPRTVESHLSRAMAKLVATTAWNWPSGCLRWARRRLSHRAALL